MSASVKAFFGVVAVDLQSAVGSEESSLGQAKVALVSTTSPDLSNDSARGISAEDMYFSIRRQETKPVIRLTEARRTLKCLDESLGQSIESVAQLGKDGDRCERDGRRQIFFSDQCKVLCLAMSR